MRRLDGRLGVLACFIASCGGTASSGTNSQGAVGTTLAAVCTRLSDKADAAAYLVGRAMVACTDPKGGSALCVSDDLQCPEMDVPPLPLTCHNACDTSEYGLACVSGEPLPPGCRQMTSPGPGGGVTFYCCKCTD